MYFDHSSAAEGKCEEENCIYALCCWGSLKQVRQFYDSSEQII